MPATTTVNKLTVVHKGSGGVVMAFPDVCKTPSPAGPIPIPYPNVAQSTDTAAGSATVTVDGNPIMLKSSYFALSTGDEAGSAMGVMSNKIKGKAYPKMYSFDVKVEGENVFRLSDIMLCNGGSPTNTPPAAELQPPLASMSASTDPKIPEVTKLAWNKGEVCCGDEVEMQVGVKNLDGSTVVPVNVSAASEPSRVRVLLGAGVEGPSGVQKWIVRRGPYQKEVKLFGRQNTFKGVEKTSADLVVKGVADAKELVGPKMMSTPKFKQDHLGTWVYAREAPWNWEVCYELEINDGIFTVTRKVDFELLEGASPTPTVLSQWKSEIQRVWNGKFKAHRKDCKRGDDCNCSFEDGCCVFPIHIRCEFGPGHGKKVKLYKGANERVRSSPRWWKSHTWWEECVNVPRTVRAHEFGHLIGMYDEYPAGAVHPARAFAEVPDSVMNKGGRIHERHVQDFFDWFKGKAEGVLGELKLVRA
jgi:hypothetical protein